MFLLFFWQGKQNSPIGCRINTDVGIRGDGEAGMAYGVGGSGAFGMKNGPVSATNETTEPSPTGSSPFHYTGPDPAK